MIVIHPSRILLALLASVHGAAALALWFSALPAGVSIVVSAVVLLSLGWQMRQLLAKRQRKLILRGEECLLDDKGLVFTGNAYCAPLLQLLYFRQEHGGSAWRGKWRAVHALVVLPDSCSTDEQRRLRHFLRWRCC